MGDAYASGSWLVRPGEEDPFITRWRAYIEWGRAAHPDGFGQARLLRGSASPSHSVSLIEWDDVASRDAWANDEALPARVGELEDLCEDVATGAYSEAARVS
jgi:heme-degrading monooxygenase HmoA